MARLSLVLLLAYTSAAYAAKPTVCRCYPDDPCWPKESAWSVFNSTIGGRLVRTNPLAKVCHDPYYDAESCEALKATWMNHETHLRTSYSLGAPLYANQSCDPFTPRDRPCTIGSYVQYAVNVSGPEDVSKTIEFATANNIRLVIRNTGHDYLGKSTGAGGLAVWMSHLKTLDFMDWQDAHYEGKAIKMGAGILTREVLAFAAEHDSTVVSGNCPTVGIAGGYIQGGGHSQLSSKFGLAADNALEYEVVDASGRLLVCNREQNADLYWALSGGGGGTYGVVLSVTVKAHPNMPTTFALIEFASEGISQDAYFRALEKFVPHTLAYTKAGCALQWVVSHPGVQQMVTCPDMTAEQVEGLIGSYCDELNMLQVKHKQQIIPFPRFSDFHSAILGAFEKGQAGLLQGGSWFIPRSKLENMDQKTSAEFMSALKQLMDRNAVIAILGFNPSFAIAGDVENAVFPGWRDLGLDLVTGYLSNVSGPISIMAKEAERVGEELIAPFQAFSPNGGTYLSEADPLDPNWKKNYYGSNYDRLLSVKTKYDPEHVFYAPTGVRSDAWSVRPDGRLCRIISGDYSEAYDKDEL
ncbi:FAD-binding domain-containing protein [Thozetella sp. PMI_491]|nr:FAD-binding domain-containing protein [Thozetella sp. PMI_491]